MEIRSIKCVLYSLNDWTTVIVIFLMIICPLVSSSINSLSEGSSSSSLHGERRVVSINCSKPLMATYYCEPPQIDPETQQPVNCGKNNRAKINCSLYDGFYCDGQKNITSFEREIECLYTNGYHFETALLLSIFLGMFGADRFYLGYPAIGLLKLCTFGCFFILQFIDVILIALQVLKPVDNSNYIMKYYGPRLKILYADNNTFPLSRNEL